MTQDYNAVEAEVVYLFASTKLIDSMVNPSMLNVFGVDPDSSALFHTAEHQRLFNILLVDFLSRSDKKAPVPQKSYLEALRSIIASPSFSHSGFLDTLASATTEFCNWLTHEITVDIWLASISTQASITLSRLQFLKMCGDISKHNILRSVGVAVELQEILQNGGITVNLESAMLLLDEFYENFHADILNYHGSSLVAFLNAIRWGIYEYLQPELQRSSYIRPVGDSMMPDFRIPEALKHQLARDFYPELLSMMRRPPYIRKFQVTKWLRLRY
jgi:hypothetical protein